MQFCIVHEITNELLNSTEEDAKYDNFCNSVEFTSKKHCVHDFFSFINFIF